MLRRTGARAGLPCSSRSEWVGSRIRAETVYALVALGVRRDVDVQFPPVVPHEGVRGRSSFEPAVYRHARRALCRVECSVSLARLYNIRRLRTASRMRTHAS